MITPLGRPSRFSGASPHPRRSSSLLAVALLAAGAGCSPGGESSDAEPAVEGATRQAAEGRTRRAAEFPQGFPVETFPLHPAMRFAYGGSPIDMVDRMRYALNFGSSAPAPELEQWYRSTFAAEGWIEQDPPAEDQVRYTKGKEIATFTFTEGEDGGSTVGLIYHRLK